MTSYIERLKSAASYLDTVPDEHHDFRKPTAKVVTTQLTIATSLGIFALLSFSILLKSGLDYTQADDIKMTGTFAYRPGISQVYSAG